MSEQPHLDINSPEFRTTMFAHFMGVKEKADTSLLVAKLAQKITFQDLTPEAWAEIVAAMEAVEATAQYVRVSIESLDYFVDDTEAMEKIKNRVIAGCKKCGCEQAKHSDHGCLGIQRLDLTDGYGESCRCDGWESH